MKLTLFEFAILFHPDKDDKDKTDKRTELLVPPTAHLAKDDKAVALFAAKKIPTEYEDRLDNIEIVVRKW